MEKKFYMQMHPMVQLLFVAFVTIISFFIFTLLGVLGAVLFFDIPITDVMGSMDVGNSDNIQVLKFLQILQSFGIFIVPALLIGLFASTKPMHFLGFGQKLDWIAFGIMVLVLAAAEPIVAYSGIINQNLNLPEFLSGIEQWMKSMEDKAMELTESFLEVKTIGGLGVNLFMVALLPGIGEELFFRGVLQKLFLKWFKNIHIAIIVTSVLFSALHMQFFGFIPRLLLGMLFGYLYAWSGSIWYPIWAHLLHNTMPVVGYYLYASDLSNTSMDDIGTSGNTWMWALGGLVLLVIFVKRFRDRFADFELKT